MVEGPATNTGDIMLKVIAIVLIMMFIVAIFVANFINSMCKQGINQLTGNPTIGIPLTSLKISLSSVCNIGAP